MAGGVRGTWESLIANSGKIFNFIYLLYVQWLRCNLNSDRNIHDTSEHTMAGLAFRQGASGRWMRKEYLVHFGATYHGQALRHAVQGKPTSFETQ